MGASVLLRSEKGYALSWDEMDANIRACAEYAYTKQESLDMQSALRKAILAEVFSTSPDGYQPLANLYFSTLGDDGHTGLSPDAENSLKTLQMAFTRLTQIFFPVAPFGVQAAPGTYEGGTLTRSVPSYVRLIGDGEEPSNYVLHGTIAQPAVNVENVNLEISGFTFTGEYMLRAGPRSRVTLRNCTFSGKFEYGIVADGGKIFVEENCFFSNCADSGIGLYSKNQGGIHLEEPFGILGQCSINTFVLSEYNAFIRAGSVFTGNPNVGKRFIVRTNSLISTSGRGLNYFPGSIAGQIDTVSGGIYE